MLHSILIQMVGDVGSLSARVKNYRAAFVVKNGSITMTDIKDE